MKCSRIELWPSRFARSAAVCVCAGGGRISGPFCAAREAVVVPASDGMDVVHGEMGPRGTGTGSWLAGRRLAVTWFRDAVCGVTKRG